MNRRGKIDIVTPPWRNIPLSGTACGFESIYIVRNLQYLASFWGSKIPIIGLSQLKQHLTDVGALIPAYEYFVPHSGKSSANKRRIETPVHQHQQSGHREFEGNRRWCFGICTTTRPLEEHDRRQFGSAQGESRQPRTDLARGEEVKTRGGLPVL